LSIICLVFYNWIHGIFQSSYYLDLIWIMRCPVTLNYGISWTFNYLNCTSLGGT
jgi:hypothetical protein